MADGRERLIEALAPTIEQLRRDIETEVEAEFAERLRQATWLKRLARRILISREIKRRLVSEQASMAPPAGFYFSKRLFDES